MDIAYIGYMECQNEPSSPALGSVQKGKIKEDLKRIFLEKVTHLEGEPTFSSNCWADLQVSFGEDPVHMFVTFRDDERDEALKECGI